MGQGRIQEFGRGVGLKFFSFHGGSALVGDA